MSKHHLTTHLIVKFKRFDFRMSKTIIYYAYYFIIFLSTNGYKMKIFKYRAIYPIIEGFDMTGAIVKNSKNFVLADLLDYISHVESGFFVDSFVDSYVHTQDIYKLEKKIVEIAIKNKFPDYPQYVREMVDFYQEEMNRCSTGAFDADFEFYESLEGEKLFYKGLLDKNKNSAKDFITKRQAYDYFKKNLPIDYFAVCKPYFSN